VEAAPGSREARSERSANCKGVLTMSARKPMIWMENIAMGEARGNPKARSDQYVPALWLVSDEVSATKVYLRRNPVRRTFRAGSIHSVSQNIGVTKYRMPEKGHPNIL
jgi:hypothetical protein